MTNSPTSNLKRLVQIERLRLVRTWFIGIGVVIILFSLSMLGRVDSNPKWWGNTFAALRDLGLLQGFVLPGLGVGLIFLVSAAVVTALLRKKEGIDL
ncbi:hypothetical protein ACVC7V_11895 [Hydrogenophaga sp. A37]|uniref:hypothetical protein n=1 Tax=Hydrogenophaga sp. A37 TaxID=1945864 RepID=UPI00117AA87F|nr:hypothetical protein [Hydrogenophaga sp. A37]